MVIDMGYCIKVTKKILLLVLSLVGIWLSFRLAIFYIPFLIGFIISLMIEPIIRYVVNKTRLSRKTGAIIVLLIIFSILIGLITWGMISAVSEASNLLQNLNIHIERVYVQIQEQISSINFERMNIPEQVILVLETSTTDFLRTITTWMSGLLTGILQTITALPVIVIYIVITVLSTYFICADKLYIIDQLEHHFPRLWIKKFNMHLKRIVTAVGNYLKAEATLAFITFIIVIIGLFIFQIAGLNVNYPLLIAIVIGLVDALPILGAGTIMIPWAVITAVGGDINLAIALFALYVIVMIQRQLLEPKIVGTKIGIHPIFTLLAMYTGFRLTGILGLYIGPIILIVLKNVFATTIDNGIFKSILERR